MASSSVRLSVAAQRLASDCGIDVNVFAGRGLIRESDVRSFVDGSHADSHTTTAPALEENGSEHRSHLVTGVPAHAQPLSRRKRQEIKALWSGTHHALPSAVSIACATRGLRQAATTQASLHGNATALIIFEVARLLRKFPVFNACFHENQIVFYDDVNIGFAVDAGNGLKVPVVHEADKKSLTAVASRLPVSALGRGTFTVTDLSGEEVFDFLPLINEGQSAILGVGGEQYVGAASVGTYQLILAFDHRLSDGRTAGSFLRCLRDRLAAHESALIGGGPTMERFGTAADIRLPLSCGRCGRTAADVEQLQGYLLASVMPFGSVCSVCVRGY
jgi:pyruvate/2-oxoglutarate dehydrogenase complex dihydrolipoamide acyltransferase (E2) component